MTAALSAGDELSIDEDVEAVVRIARHLAAALADPANREEACDILRRLGIQIGLTFSKQKFGPKRIVRRLKGGVVVYGDADFPAAARPTVAADTAKNKTIGPEPDTLPANPSARALLAVDPNARRKARKSLDRRQVVDTTSTDSSRKPGRVPDRGQLVRSRK